MSDERSLPNDNHPIFAHEGASAPVSSNLTHRIKPANPVGGNTISLRIGICLAEFALRAKGLLVIPLVLPHGTLLRSVTISAKISLSLKRKLERYRIMVSEVVRGALEHEVMKAEQDDLATRLDEISSRLSAKLRREDVVAAVRASRRER